ncbi:MAG TPA: EAL domain-containing protein [Solirubrobacteraceae bacterium]|jgi:EAL domain-containing protein (putative c-di-GMP-specific phosphodiesterase class I)|nr:EAL domain-containing protein [Solirubrobacteraceae bacterium]
MFSSTTPHATPRVLLGRSAPRGEWVRGLVDARALSEGFSSPAGLHRRPWLERLRRALDGELFVLHFQPIVALSDRRISHYEALLRLADEPDGCLVAPGRFLPAAERYGLVRDIDRMVVDHVAALLAAEPDPEARIAVNMSALSVTDRTMLTHVERRLRWHGVNPSQLVIEITETSAISDMDSARSFCAGVLELGCDLALDDFGAGFGSFQYLKHLPFSYLKIDGDFIRRLPVSRTDQLVVRALAGVVRGMGAETIAEFVGDETTIEMLRSYGVDYAQGFAVGRPQPTLAAYSG